MVDVSDKDITLREAVAAGAISMDPKTFGMIMNEQIFKGDVLGVAKVAGIMAAKKTSELIPMCHPLNMTHIDIQFDPREADSTIGMVASVKTWYRTGAEMEALVAASIAALPASRIALARRAVTRSCTSGSSL